MDFKIISLEKYEAELCLHRSINDNDQDTVIVTSFIYDESEEDTSIMLETEMAFPNAEMAQNFIGDYSVKSAEDWLVSEADRQGINLV